jgi:hypothetical protein
MFWTPELASFLEDAPFPATKEELLDYSMRAGCPQLVIDNIMEIEDEEVMIEGIEDLWPEYEDVLNDEFLYNDDQDDQFY